MNGVRRLFLAAALLGAAAAALAHSEHAAPPAAVPPATGVTLHFPDVALTGSDGRAQRLASEVFGGRIVVLDFVYTSCSTVCPVVSAILARVQAALGERAGRDVQLVSLSVDPLRDTPERLRDYAARHRAGPAWSWLTGRPDDIAAVLRAAGTWTPRFEDHPAVILVGDPQSGRWSRHYGFVTPAELLARVDALLQARAHVAHQRAAGGG